MIFLFFDTLSGDLIVGLLTYIRYMRHLYLCVGTTAVSVGCRGNIVDIHLFDKFKIEGEKLFIEGVRNNQRMVVPYCF